MMQDNIRNKRLLLVILLLLGVVSLMVVIFLLGRPGKLQLSESPILPRHNGEVLVLPNQHLRFFNGRGFIDYNPLTGEAVTLFEETSFPAVSMVRWSGSGDRAVIQSAFHTPDDFLGKYLDRHNKNLADRHWWLFDLVNNTYVLLPDEFADIFWGNNNLFGYMPAIEDHHTGAEAQVLQAESIYKISSSGNYEVLVELGAAFYSIVGATPRGVFYLTLNESGFSVEVVLPDGAVRTVVGDIKSDNVAVSPDGRYLVYPIFNEERGVDDHDGEGTLAVEVDFEIFEVSAAKVYDRLSGHLDVAVSSFSSDSEVLFILDKPADKIELTTYTLDRGKTQVDVAEPAEGAFGDLAPFGIQGNKDGLLLIESVGFYYVGGPLAKQVMIPKLALPWSIIERPGYTVFQSEDPSTATNITVNVFVGDVGRVKTEVFELLDETGVAADLLYVDFERLR